MRMKNVTKYNLAKYWDFWREGLSKRFVQILSWVCRWRVLRPDYCSAIVALLLAGSSFSPDTLGHQWQSVRPISVKLYLFYVLILLEMECLSKLI